MGMAERIRSVVVETMFEGEEAMPGGSLTISLGVATFPMQASDKGELVERADQALYRAKALGRNRVVVHGDESVN